MSDDTRITHACTDTEDNHAGYLIFCPACQHCHLFDGKWKFNNDLDKPTFTPSLLVYGNKATRKNTNGKYGQRCHSFVTDGKIQFLSDCTHSMARTTVDLEAF